MFDKLYKENLKLLMNWDDSQFNSFVTSFKNLHSFHFSERKSLMHTEAYFELTLSLFFISLQLDLENKIKDRKSILLSLLLFYAVNEDKLLRQTEESLHILNEYIQHLVASKLISIPCGKNTYAFLYSFFDHSSDTLLESDRVFINDILISTDPVVVDRRHAMLYYDNPQESIFAVKKPYPTPTQFFDEMFKTSGQIQSKMLKGFYVDRLHRLMDTQAKKSIFPF